MTDSRQQAIEARRLIEILVGPCSREHAEQAVEHLQTVLDAQFPELGAAIAIDFSPALSHPPESSGGMEAAFTRAFPLKDSPDPAERAAQDDWRFYFEAGWKAHAALSPESSQSYAIHLDPQNADHKPGITPESSQQEAATFDPSWADARPLCHVCKREIPAGEAIILPGGANGLEDDDEFVGLLAHRRCPESSQQAEGEP